MQEKSIESQLSFAEDVLLKLKAQTEQEIAMTAVLPIRFQENISAFETFMPSIANRFTDYKPSRSFEFFCTENGIPNVFFMDEKKPFYESDPYEQCQQQVQLFLKESKITRFRFHSEYNVANHIHVKYLNEMSELYYSSEREIETNDSIENGVPLLLMFGVGLGYQLGYIFEGCTPKNIFIFEPDLDLFYASLYAFDWKTLIDYLIKEQLGLHIFLGQDKHSLMDDLTSALAKRGEFLAANMVALCHYSSEKTLELIDTVLNKMYLLTTGWGFFDDSVSALGHSAKNIYNKIPFLLKNKKVQCDWSDIPVFVIANGPSLDEALPVINKLKNDVIICACGSSIATLYKVGIKPDIYFTVERTQTSANFVKLIDDKEFLKDILFLSSDVLHPDAHQYFNHIGLGFQVSEPMYPLMMANFKDTNKYEPLTWINPLVGNMGVSYPIHLGFKKIYLFGIDNGFKVQGHHHSRYSAYYDKSGNPIEAFSGMALANGGLEIPGNFGGVVIANELFATSVNVTMQLLKENKNVTCFNCGDGALIEGALPMKISDVVVSKLAFDKSKIVDYIYNNCFKPINVSKNELLNGLSVDFFNEVINVLNADWEKPFYSRYEILERMQRQYEYVFSLFSTKYHLIYRTLIGSINYAFSLISIITYRFKDIEATLSIAKQAVAIFMNYLNEMKEIYPVSLNYEDKRDDGMFHIINEIKSQ